MDDEQSPPDADAAVGRTDEPGFGGEAELETLRSRVNAADERARMLALRLEVERCARRLRIVDEDAAFRLIDAAALTLDADGTPANVEEALSDLTRQRPWLVAASSDAGPSASPANPRRDASRSLTRDDIRRMTPDQINANWDAVMRAMSAP